MNLIQSIINNDLDNAAKIIIGKIKESLNKHLEEAKQYIASELMITERINTNIQRIGKIQRYRKRIRTDKNGRVQVQKNRTRSSMKGYIISGHSVKRISAIQRIRKAKNLKRSWKGKRRSQLRRSLFRRRISMRRRKTIGIR
jgi:hypothetical protein